MSSGSSCSRASLLRKQLIEYGFAVVAKQEQIATQLRVLRYSITLGSTPISSLYYSSLLGRRRTVLVVKIPPIRQLRSRPRLFAMDHSLLVMAQALQTTRLSISERVGMKDLRVSRGMNLKEGIRGVAGVMVTITIDETGTTGEMEVGEEGGEGDEVVIPQAGTTDRHTGTGIVMTGDRCLLDGRCDVGEADQGVLRQGAPDMGTLRGGTNEPGVLPARTHVDPRRLRNRLP